MSYLLPYDFVLKNLYPFRPSIRKILGCYALYQEKKLLMLLRDSHVSPEFNGVFVATHPEFFAELQDEIHASRMEFDLDGSKDSWIFISEDLPDFNEKVQKVCSMIQLGDARIGK